VVEQVDMQRILETGHLVDLVVAVAMEALVVLGILRLLLLVKVIMEAVVKIVHQAMEPAAVVVQGQQEPMELIQVEAMVAQG
jgi:hypothetical protein